LIDRIVIGDRRKIHASERRQRNNEAESNLLVNLFYGTGTARCSSKRGIILIRAGQGSNSNTFRKDHVRFVDIFVSERGVTRK